MFWIFLYYLFRLPNLYLYGGLSLIVLASAGLAILGVRAYSGRRDPAWWWYVGPAAVLMFTSSVTLYGRSVYAEWMAEQSDKSGHAQMLDPPDPPIDSYELVGMSVVGGVCAAALAVVAAWGCAYAWRKKVGTEDSGGGIGKIAALLGCAGAVGLGIWQALAVGTHEATRGGLFWAATMVATLGAAASVAWRQPDDDVDGFVAHATTASVLIFIALIGAAVASHFAGLYATFDNLEGLAGEERRAYLLEAVRWIGNHTWFALPYALLGLVVGGSMLADSGRHALPRSTFTHGLAAIVVVGLTGGLVWYSAASVLSLHW